MLIGIYRISATLLDDALLPYYKGSTFRGAFGGCLKRAVCAVRQKECPECLLSSRCVYAQLFEPKTWQSPEETRTAAPPHPYMIEPPEHDRRQYTAGDSFDFNLILFGEMNASLPYFVYALELMGEQGIGTKAGNQRARFVLRGVSCQSSELYTPETSKLLPVPPLEKLELRRIEPSEKISVIKLNLLTPLRFKNDNHLQRTLDFPLLVRTMLRRVSSLFNAWGNGEPDLDYRGMIARAEQVKVTDGRLHWQERERYSSRQEQAMSFGGMMGYVTYQGPLDEYIPLLHLCQQLHIGKQTTFGLGRFRVEELRS